jgi:arylsulfatase
LTPTFLDLAGIQPPGTSYRGREVASIRGRSMATYLRGDAATVHPTDQSTGWELFGHRGIRQGDWKAVSILPPHGPGRWQLYNLATDLGETNDLAAANPDKLRELLQLWEAYVEQTGVLLAPSLQGKVLKRK